MCAFAVGAISRFAETGAMWAFAGWCAPSSAIGGFAGQVRAGFALGAISSCAALVRSRLR
jgi:hypothetical protein